jgi:drug/metabolite transporter (DMT)-like permease
MLAVVLALAAAVSYSGSDYAAGLAARGASVVRVTVVAQVTNAVLLTPAVPFVSAGAPPPASLAWGAVAGVSGVVGTIALYLGFRHAAFSVASSVSAVGSAAFSVLAGLLFGERPGPLSLAGIALALPAIAAVSVGTGQAATGQAATGQAATGGAHDPAGVPGAAGHLRRSATGRHAAGVGWGLVAGAAIGLFFTGLNRAGSGSDLWPLAVAELTAVVAVIGVAAVTRQLGPPPAGTRWLSVLTGITAAAGTFCYFLATHRGLLAITAVITSLYPAGTILLARLLLGERLTAVRIAGLCLAAASVSLIAVAGAG